MASALDEFRAQREAANDVHARLREVAELLGSLRQDTANLAHDETLRNRLREEQTWLRRAETVLAQARQAREWEAQHFWPAVWRRWLVAVAFALATAFAAGAGYGWSCRPYEAELASLRSRAELGDAVAQRLFRMTPAERKQFEALMKWTETPKR